MKAHFEDEQRECVRKDVATDGPALVLREDVARADSCSCSPSPNTTQSQTRSISFYNFYIVIFIIFYLASGFAWLRPPLGTTHSSSNRSRRPSWAVDLPVKALGSDIAIAGLAPNELARDLDQV